MNFDWLTALNFCKNKGKVKDEDEEGRKKGENENVHE